MRRRIIIAFAISPAVVPLGVLASCLAYGVRLRESFVVTAAYAGFTYGAAIILGLPAFYLFSRRGWTRWWQHAVVGAAIGAAILGGVAVAADKSLFRLTPMLEFAGMGVLSTTVFWWIVQWRK